MQRLYELAPGTVFRHEEQLYLRTAHGILLFKDFVPFNIADVPSDAQVTVVGELALGVKDVTGRHTDVVFRKSEGTLQELLEECIRIINSDIDWADKYDAIFSDRISQRVFDSICLEGYVDPDTSYEEDVMAFINAFRETMSRR